MPDVKTEIADLRSRVTKLEPRIKALETKASGGDDSGDRPRPSNLNGTLRDCSNCGSLNHSFARR
jgi:hypothetical protein